MTRAAPPAPVKVRVEHGFYGCDTGCCGHAVIRTSEDGEECEEWSFGHPDENNPASFEAFARDLVRRAWPDLEDYELDFSEVSYG